MMAGTRLRVLTTCLHHAYNIRAISLMYLSLLQLRPRLAGRDGGRMIVSHRLHAPLRHMHAPLRHIHAPLNHMHAPRTHFSTIHTQLTTGTNSTLLRVTLLHARHARATHISTCPR
ncbi:hypothetical protein B0H34DRAFT_489646 [Crassisporium funariophilum]|nr:hypothetical protein B0H34DRAFT_489646 [Crassisporium funariophilum]